MATKSDILEALGLTDQMDAKSADVLIKALKSEQLPGFDYIKFKQSLIALKALPMDESTAIRSAFATASTLGVTKEKLIKTAKHYQQILKKEKQQFDEAANGQITNRIASKEGEIEKIDAQLADCHRQIEELRSLIKQLESRKVKAVQEKEVAAEKINEAKERFDKSYESIIQAIEQDVKSIEEHL